MMAACMLLIILNCETPKIVQPWWNLRRKRLPLLYLT